MGETTVESMCATCLFVATAQCTILHCRLAVRLFIGGLYTDLVPHGEEPGTSRSDHCYFFTPTGDLQVGDFPTHSIQSLLRGFSVSVSCGVLKKSSAPTSLWWSEIVRKVKLCQTIPDPWCRTSLNSIARITSLSIPYSRWWDFNPVSLLSTVRVCTLL